ncbi:hypothetical protein BHE74_00041255 [Ensete ventricosum]|nr:hypothetical protein BHE74_00041255 [Ensete ventricosum]
MASPAAFSVMERSQVPPAPGSLPETSLPLTFFDVMWLNRDPVECLFFCPFTYPICSFMQAIVPALKSSLSFALQRFYPFAGRIWRCPGCCDKYEIHYVDGDSISFALAEHGGDFEYLSWGHARNVSELLPLIPRIVGSGDDRLLLAVQVTLFPDRAVAVAVTFHHAVCDGTGFKQFMASNIILKFQLLCRQDCCHCRWAASSIASSLATEDNPLPLPSGHLLRSFRFDNRGRSSTDPPLKLYQITGSSLSIAVGLAPIPSFAAISQPLRQAREHCCDSSCPSAIDDVAINNPSHQTPPRPRSQCLPSS